MQQGMTTPASSRSERRAAGMASGTRPSRAGRHLPTAVGVGLSLGAVIIASLIFRKEAFLGVVTVAACLAVWELRGGLAQGKINVPLLPSMVGAIAMIHRVVRGWRAGPDSLLWPDVHLAAALADG